MQYDDYLAARRTRLLDHAVTLGDGALDADDAGPLVDEVLERQRRRIERSKDPDDLVHDAVAAAVALRTDPTQQPSRRPSRRAVLAMAGAVVLVLVVAAVSHRSRPGPTAVVPALFGLDTTSATRVLHDAGFEVATTTDPACEPTGLVLGSTPASGRRAEQGSKVVVSSAAAPVDPCPDLADRTAAWALVAFARSGPSATLGRVADTVVLTVGDRTPVTILDPARRAAWPAALDALAHDLSAPALRGTRTPRLLVGPATDSPSPCTPDPDADEPGILRLQFQPDPRRVVQCPLMIDLVRVDGLLTAVTIRPSDAVTRGKDVTDSVRTISPDGVPAPGKEAVVIREHGRGVIPR